MIEEVNLAAVMAAPEFPALVAEYSEVAMEGMPAPVVNFERYEAYERAGALHVVAAFSDENLVGFLAVLVDPLNRHFSVPLAVVDSFFVAQSSRGTAGIGLLARAEEIARRRGSPKLFISAPVGSRLQALLPKCDYVVTNVVYAKDLS